MIKSMGDAKIFFLPIRTFVRQIATIIERVFEIGNKNALSIFETGAQYFCRI